MPSTAEIIQVQADIAAAVAAGITPAQMVAVLDLAIAFAVSQGDITVQYNAMGNTVERSLEQARAARAYYQGEVERQAARAVPLVILQADFS